MELTHHFQVPASVEETWASFNDLVEVAQCFPGAEVTEHDGDSFAGTVKVKLGPIALVYLGSGTFVERDQAQGRMVIEAKGKDKRGNGTAGANITVTMATSPTGDTDLEVLTDLAITGKPAQFGRGVMQDVSDKLLGQFVACLGQRLAEPEAAAADSGSGETASAGAESDGAGATAAAAGAADETPEAASSSAGPGPRVSQAPKPQPSASDDNALDLGATVLPVLLKSYGKQLAAALAGLVVLRLIFKRVRRNR